MTKQLSYPLAATNRINPNEKSLFNFSWSSLTWKCYCLSRSLSITRGR